MPDITGIELMKYAKECYPGILCILITAYATKESAIQALKLGAYDYLEKPFDIEEFNAALDNAMNQQELRRENVSLKNALQRYRATSEIIGGSAAMEEISAFISRVAPTDSTILLKGESGTGKELVAEAIHSMSARAEEKFVTVNCGAMPESLLESELFGHKKGAFTGADRERVGLLEVAHRGTVFLDEITEIPRTMQVKLLRALQNKKIRQIGGTDELQLDIRVIAATNQDIEMLVERGDFREDLYYRINVIPLDIPPLRDRREDIPLLARHFFQEYQETLGKNVQGISEEAMELLERYDWPGNVREVKNIIERAVALAEAEIITPQVLPPEIREGSNRIPSKLEISIPGSGVMLEERVRDFRKAYLREALGKSAGGKKKAADLLGMSFRSFRYYLAKYGLDDK